MRIDARAWGWYLAGTGRKHSSRPAASSLVVDVKSSRRPGHANSGFDLLDEAIRSAMSVPPQPVPDWPPGSSARCRLAAA